MKSEKKYGKPPRLFKVDISYLEYEVFAQYYKKIEVKEMLYLYFDTSSRLEEAILFRSNVRLRVRIRENHCSLELKYKDGGPSKNYSQAISLLELNLMFQGSLPNGEIRRIITDLNLASEVLLVGTAYTKRAKRLFKEGILVLDKTVSLNKCHFQIEFRSNKSISEENLAGIKGEFGISEAGSSSSKLNKIWTMQES